MEFPAHDLEVLALELDAKRIPGSNVIRLAIRRYGELADRLVMDNAHSSARIGTLRARLAILDPDGAPL